MPSHLVDSAHLTAGFDPVQYASDFVRAYCKQVFDYVAGDVVLVNPRPDHTGQLPQLPVSAVTLVEAWMPNSAGAWTWQTLSNYQWTTDGYILDTTTVTPSLVLDNVVPWPSWPWMPESLRVTYTHGYTVIPDDLQGVVLRIAAEIQANLKFRHSLKVGEINEVFPQTATQNGIRIYLRDQDAAILDDYKQVTLA